MQRPIKFRAWDIEEGKMVYQRGSMLDCIDNFFCPVLIPTKNEIELMQYTGLKDKNGVECYWNDWVTDGINHKFLVTPDYHLLARLSEIEFEVIGNIYEKPELIDKRVT